MGALVDSVGGILSRVERRVETASQNISNSATPGFKRAVSFDTVLEGTPSGRADSDVGMGVQNSSRLAIDFSAGQLQDTGNPDDLAISGSGFFAVRAHDGGLFYTRQGQFRRDADGRMVDGQGRVLQQRGGGDMVLHSGDFNVLGDGTMMQAGEVVGRIAVVDFVDPAAVQYADNGLFSVPEAMVSPMEAPSVRQGALEASNVSLASEMMTIMAALREAQAGQHLMNVYDDLMGRAVTTFGQG